MLLKVLVVLVTIAICFQRLSMALGNLGWGFGGLGSITAILIPMLIIGLLDACFSKKEKFFFGSVLLFAIVGSIVYKN